MWITTIGSIGAALVFGAFYQRYAERRDRERCPPPGAMITIGDRQLHLIRKGTGAPTVVFENGAGGSSLTLWQLQDELAKSTMVCTYDRAGLGWSDASGQPLKLEQRVEDLHALLAAAQVPGPYLLVGYSYGGFLIRLFANAHPEKVAGMVFVDAGHEAVYAQPDVWSKNVKMMRTAMRAFGHLARVGILRLFRLRAMLPPMKSYTEMQRKVLDSLFPAARSYFTAADEFSSIERVGDAMSGLNTPGILGDLPIAVIAHGDPFPGPYAILETHWFEGQQQLAALSTNSKLIVDDKHGHFIPFENPELVIEVIREVIDKVRSNERMSA